VTAVLDASAVLALLHNEPGAGVVMQSLDDARISAVNHAEVLSRLADAGVPESVADRLLDSLQIVVEPFTRAHSVTSAALRGPTRVARLSLGDRACLALAAELGVSAVTADRVWGNMTLGVDVKLIR